MCKYEKTQRKTRLKFTWTYNTKTNNIITHRYHKCHIKLHNAIY